MNALLYVRLLVFLIAPLALAACQTSRPNTVETAASAEEAGPYRLYVGTGTSDAEEGIYTLQFDPGGRNVLSRTNAVEKIFNSTFLALSPDAQYLYAVSESSEKGTVSAYRIDQESGALAFLNRQPSGGASPAYVSTDRTGEWVLVANYGGGSVALLPVKEDGSLGPAADVVQHEGSGPNEERQEAPHAHYVRVGPNNRYAYAADLGTDQVRIYRLDTENGRLAPAAQDPVETPPGAGPRHLDFHPNGRYAYLVSELTGTVTAYDYDAETGALEALQTLSVMPDDFDGHNQSADIHVHPSGRWLYVSNRGDYGSITTFAIDEATGRLTLLGHQTNNINWPRNFAIDPTGRHLLVANRRGNEVVAFRIDQETGRLSPTRHRVEVPEPTNITFVVPTE